MNELIREWIEKAEADFRTTERESRVTDGPNWDAVCFHAQQAIEKYFKAPLLQEQSIPFPKIHDLSILAKPLFSVYPEWQTCRDSLERLSLFAVEFRYPGKTASEQDAKEALVIMREWRVRLREALKLVRMTRSMMNSTRTLHRRLAKGRTSTTSTDKMMLICRHVPGKQGLSCGGLLRITWVSDTRHCLSTIDHRLLTDHLLLITPYCPITHYSNGPAHSRMARRRNSYWLLRTKT